MLLRQKLLVLLSGWAVSRFIFSLLRDITAGDFVLEPGAMAMTIMPFLGLLEYRGNHKARVANTFAAGIVADSLLYSLMRPGNDIPAAVAMPFDGVIWAGSVGVLLLFILLYWHGNKVGLPARDSGSSEKPYWLILSCTATVAVYRVMYLSLQHLPNELRSMFLAGIEIHHIVIGALVLVGLFTRHTWAHIFRTPWLGILAGIAIGMILDQSVYISLYEVSDASYNSRASWWGAILLTLAFGLLAYLTVGRGDEKTTVA